MIDIKFLRENPDLVKENIKKKFQDAKLPLVDEVIALDAESRKVKQEADELRAQKNKISKEIGALMAQGKKKKQKQRRQKWLPSPGDLPNWKQKSRNIRKNHSNHDENSPDY